MDMTKLSDVKFKDDLLRFNYKILQSFAKNNFLPSNLKKEHLAEVIAAHNSGNKDLVAEKIDFVMKERCITTKINSKKKVLPTVALIEKYLKQTNSKKASCSAKTFNMETNHTNIIQTRSMNKAVSLLKQTKPNVIQNICPKTTMRTFQTQTESTRNFLKQAITPVKYISKLAHNNKELKKKEDYLREINLIDRKESVTSNFNAKEVINSTIELSYKKGLATNKSTMDFKFKTATNSRKFGQPVITISKRSLLQTTFKQQHFKIKTTKNDVGSKFKFSPKITSTPTTDRHTQYNQRKNHCNTIYRISDIDKHLHSLIKDFCIENSEEAKEDQQSNVDYYAYSNNCNYTKVNEETKTKDHKKIQQLQTLPSIDEAFGNMKGKTPNYMKPLYVHVSTESERHNDVKSHLPIYSNTGKFLLKMSNNKNSTPLPHTITTNSSVSPTTAYVNNYYLPNLQSSDAEPLNAIGLDSDNYTSQLCVPDQFDLMSDEMTITAYERENFEEVGSYKNVVESCEYFDTEEIWGQASTLNNGLSVAHGALDHTSYSNIAQMVEDALCVASMDVKYMESSGMNIHMQCIKCRWAGPRLLLEHHIRLEHDELIYKSIGFSWMLSVNIDSVLQADGRLSELIEGCEGTIFVVNFIYQSPKLMISLFSLVEENRSVYAVITVYPKTVGAPVNWHQIVFMLPPILPNYVHEYCTFDLADLHYLPRSTVEYIYQDRTDKYRTSSSNVDVPFFISVTFE